MFLLSPVIGLWDIAIVIMIVAGTCLAGIGLHAGLAADVSLLTRFFALLFGCVALLCTLLVVYGAFIEPQRIAVTRMTAKLPVREPIKIAVIADAHVGPYKGERYMRRVVNRINALLPDVVLIAGDMMYDGRDGIEGLQPLKDLRPVSGTFAVLGNHDYGMHGLIVHGKFINADVSGDVAAYLRALGMIVLENDHRIVSFGPQEIAIAGITDAWAPVSSLSGALAGIPPGTPTILLAHNPDVILDADNAKAHIIVSGHTHAGQIRLPWIGPLVSVPTRVGNAFAYGKFDLPTGNQLFVTRGIGESGPRARLFAPPEIMVLEASGQ